MPIREFMCNNCKKVTEHILLGDEDKVITGLLCKCGSKNTKRQISRSSFKFKQGGFSASSVDISDNTPETIDLGKTKDLL
ncbi:MAG: FmdB family zinc ribbon protein [Nanoarchaeota archaeon]